MLWLGLGGASCQMLPRASQALNLIALGKHLDDLESCSLFLIGLHPALASLQIQVLKQLLLYVSILNSSLHKTCQ
jgi:hypothetical protein